MRIWLRRARGLVGLGVVGSIVGAVLGGGITAVAAFQAYGTVPTFGLVTGMLFGALFGGSTTSGFGLLLTVTARGKSIEELSLFRGMVMAAAASSLIAVGVSAMARGSLFPLRVVLSQFAVFGGFGAALGGGLLTAAKKARRTELQRDGDESRRIES